MGQIKVYDAVIIGKGPAGITAAVYLHRAGRSVLVLGRDEGTLALAHAVDNYYGMSGLSGAQLHQKGVRAARRLGVKVVTAEAVAVRQSDGLNMVTAGGREVAGKLLLLAPGSRRKPSRDIGAAAFEGMGVSACAVCDGFFYKGKPVAVTGSGAYAAHEAAYLAGICSRVTLLTDGQPAPDKLDARVAVDTSRILGIRGGADGVEAVETEGGRVEAFGVFLAEGSASADVFASSLGLAMRGNDIEVDASFKTSIEGIYAAGDCTGGLKQVCKASADGAHAAMAMNKALLHMNALSQQGQQ